MAKFNWTRKGESKHSDAEVELLLNQQEKLIVRESIAPQEIKIKELKDQIKSFEDSQSNDVTRLTKELAAANKALEAANGELKPFKLNAKKTEIINEVKGANILNDKKLNDAMVLAGVNFEQDDATSAKAKIEEFIKQEGRDEYKYVQPKEEQTPPTTLNPAQIAGITETNVKNSEGDSALEVLQGTLSGGIKPAF